MGTSTDGLIFFGWAFDEGHEFPWSEQDEDDPEEWWRNINGYKPPFQLYDERGEYPNGEMPTDAQLKTYYDLQRCWDQQHPLPFELVNYCYHDNPMWALAVPRSVLRAHRGFPLSFDPQRLSADATGLRQFCEKHGIELAGEPQWYLASYWG
jgi:hypothetical protein